MNQVVSKVGIHCVGPKRKDYGPFLQKINAAGRQLSLVKVRDDYGAIDEAVALWPEVLTIGARTEWDDAPYDVNLAFNRIMAQAHIKPDIVYWEYFNERDGDYDQQADLYISLMPRLKEAGALLCMFNCASGTPRYPSEDGGVAYAAIARACKFAKDNQIDALLGLHEYQTPGGTIERHNILADYLTAHNALIPIAITEYGFETFPGTSPFMTMIRANDPEYMRDGRVLGCATWTLGGGGWGGSNFENALPQLGDYISTVDPVSPPVVPQTSVIKISPAGRVFVHRGYNTDIIQVITDAQHAVTITTE